jgi:hypothetical protein
MPKVNGRPRVAELREEAVMLAERFPDLPDHEVEDVLADILGLRVLTLAERNEAVSAYRGAVLTNMGVV